MTTRDEWYKPNLLYNIHYRSPKKPEPRKPDVDVETIHFNPSFCINREHDCEPHYRMVREFIGREKEKAIDQERQTEERGNVAEAAIFYTGFNRSDNEKDAGISGHGDRATAINMGCGSGGKERGIGNGEESYSGDIGATAISTGCSSSLRERGTGIGEDGYDGDDEATPVSSGCSISLRERDASIGEEVYFGDHEATATMSIGCSWKDGAVGIGEDESFDDSDDTDSMDNEELDDEEISSAFGIMSVYCNSELHSCVGRETKTKTGGNGRRGIALLLELTRKLII